LVTSAVPLSNVSVSDTDALANFASDRTVASTAPALWNTTCTLTNAFPAASGSTKIHPDP
jgi:hypothetical protein